jgi:hypothetical protein
LIAIVVRETEIDGHRVDEVGEGSPSLWHGRDPTYTLWVPSRVPKVRPRVSDLRRVDCASPESEAPSENAR